MARTLRPVSYHVRVEPRRLGDLGVASVSDSLIESDEEKQVEECRERCEAIAEQVKRHVDLVGSVTIRTETEAVCEHCGSDWIHDSDSPHNGGCCEKDWEVYEALEANAASGGE